MERQARQIIAWMVNLEDIAGYHLPVLSYSAPWPKLYSGNDKCLGVEYLKDVPNKMLKKAPPSGCESSYYLAWLYFGFEMIHCCYY